MPEMRQAWVYSAPDEAPGNWTDVLRHDAAILAVTPSGKVWAWGNGVWLLAGGTGGDPGVHLHDLLYAPLVHPHVHNHDGSYAPTHAHPYSSDAHNHSGVYEPVHSHPYAATAHNHDANYSLTSHTHQGGGSGMNPLKKTADQVINAGAGVFTDITGLTFPVVAGVDYGFFFYIAFRSAATTTGWKAGVNCPAGTLDFWAGSQTVANGAAGVATHTERHNTVRDDMTQLTATVTQAVDLAIRIEGRYLCTANGTFAARFANELAANTQLTVLKGSWGYWI